MRASTVQSAGLSWLVCKVGSSVARLRTSWEQPALCTTDVATWSAGARAILSPGLRENLAGMTDGGRIAVRIRLTSEEDPARAAQRAEALAARLESEGYAAWVAGTPATVVAAGLTPGALLEVAERPDVIALEPGFIAS